MNCAGLTWKRGVIASRMSWVTCMYASLAAARTSAIKIARSGLRWMAIHQFADCQSALLPSSDTRFQRGAHWSAYFTFALQETFFCRQIHSQCSLCARKAAKDPRHATTHNFFCAQETLRKRGGDAAGS